MSSTQQKVYPPRRRQRPHPAVVPVILALACLIGGVGIATSQAGAAKNPCASLTKKGEKLVDAGRYRGAQAVLEKAVEACGTDSAVGPRPFIALGQVHLTLERYRDAVPLFTQALAINKDLPLAHINLSACYTKLAQFDKAIEHGKAAQKTDNKRWRFLATYNVGFAHFSKATHKKDREDLSAENYFKKALRMQPEHADSYFYLGVMEELMKGDDEAAKKLFAKACTNGHAGGCAKAKQL